MSQSQNPTPNQSFNSSYLFSTNMNPQYLRSNFVKNVTVSVNGVDEEILDIFAPSYVDFINNLQLKNVTEYTGNPITTVSYNQYSNTSAWWMIIAMNGYLHPLEIPSGQTLLVPDAQNALVRTQISSTAPSSKVQVI